MGKSIKRIYQLTLSLTLLFILIATCSLICFTTRRVDADEPSNPSVVVESKTVHRGQAVEISVDLTSNPTGLTALCLKLTYDTDALKLLGYTEGNGLKEQVGNETKKLDIFVTGQASWESYASGDGIKFLWTGNTPVSSTGKLLTLVFETNVQAEQGDYDVTMTLDAENTRQDYLVPVDVDVTSGKITLTRGIYGTEYYNYDGTLIWSEDHNEDGQTPVFGGTEPTRPDDDYYSYTFAGWTAVPTDKANTIVYYAKYDSTPIEYDVFMYIDGLVKTSEGGNTVYSVDETKLDGVIDTATELYFADSVGYGMPLNLQFPAIEDYTFYGWYNDEAFEYKFNKELMPVAKNGLNLYGYYKYNIREVGIPTITLSVDETRSTANKVYINVDLVENSGVSAMNLTIDYDLTKLNLVGYENGEVTEIVFDRTPGELNQENLKFMWDGGLTNYEGTGNILVLEFDVLSTATAGTYEVGFTYKEMGDALYIDEDGDVMYTRLNINYAEVVIGTVNELTATLPGSEDVIVKVETEESFNANVELKVEVVTQDVALEYGAAKIEEVAGENMKLKSAYSIWLEQNGQRIEPTSELTIRIKLSDDEKANNNLKVYYIDDEGNFTLTNTWVDGDEIVFEANSLATWAIVGEAQIEGMVNSASNTLTITLTMLLAITTLSFALILIAKDRKSKKDS